MSSGQHLTEAELRHDEQVERDYQRRQSDLLVIRTLRSAIVCAWLVMVCMVVGVVVNTCGQRSRECPPCPQAERP